MICWRQNALASLVDKPRSGAPQKLNSGYVQRLVQWARDEPLTVSALLARQHLGGQAQSIGAGMETHTPFFKKAEAKKPFAKQL